GLAGVAQDFGDGAFGEVIAFGVGDDLDDDLVAFLGVFALSVLDDDGLGDLAAVGVDDPLAAAFDELTREAGALALDDLDDVADPAWAGGAAATLVALEADFDGVAREGVLGGFGGDEDALFADGDLGLDEAEAADVFAEGAEDEAFVALGDLGQRGEH